VLAADPADYSVAADGTIEIQAMETLGHYADWLDIRTQRLRDANGYSFRRPVRIGDRLRLVFDGVDRQAFETRRLAYHQALQERFFRQYRIRDSVAHRVRSGESVWLLARRDYDVPVWLLRQYNPDLQLDRVRPGMSIQFPVLERLRASADTVRIAETD
jgi:membrane-bound lytic murein transglycosylase D